MHDCDWVWPWRVDKPAAAKPDPGVALDRWLDQRLLYRHRHDLYGVLASIDERLARNEVVPELNEEVVAEAVLRFLQSADADPKDQSRVRMPVHKARIFLEYFSRRFRLYCREHQLREVRIPLIREFSLDDGMLNGDLFVDLANYRQCTKALCDAMTRLVLDDTRASITSADCLVLIASSAALYGGLPFEAQWQGVVASLAHPLKSDGRIIWFDLDEPTPCRWIADPMTEGLLRQLLTRQFLPIKGSMPSPDVLRKAMKELLALSAAPTTIGRVIARAVIAMHSRYFPPDVAAIRQGVIANTPVPHEPWMRWLLGTRHAAPRERIVLRAPQVHSRSQVTTLMELGLFKVIEGVRDAVAFNPKALRQEGHAQEQSRNRLSYHTKALRVLSVQEQALIAVFKEAGQLGRERQSFAFGLICYAKDLVELGGAKRVQLAASTIANYVAHIFNHLETLHYKNLVEMDTLGRAEAYSNAIRLNGFKHGRVDLRTAFEGFERSILRHMDLEDEVDWGLIPGRSLEKHLPRADANLIGHGLYRCLFEGVAEQAQSSALAQMAGVLLIVMYHFGLRTGEAVELTANAIEFNADFCVSVRVTRSQLTSRKSGNALRTVGPVKLPFDEYEYLQCFVSERLARASGRKRERSGAYLFDPSNAGRLEAANQAMRFVVEMLREVSGDPNLRARHFRHTFVSNLFVSGRNNINGEGGSPGRDEWQRTWMSGHASPDTGIISYTHLAEVAHYYCTCRLLDAEASLGLLSRLAGNAERSLERHLLRVANSPSNHIAEKYLAALRENFPCTKLLVVPTARAAYTFLVSAPILSHSLNRMDWRAVWEIYAMARVGKKIEDDDCTQIIWRRVRALEKKGLLAPRSRRPELDDECKDVIDRIWTGFEKNDVFGKLLPQVVEGLSNARSKVRLPAGIATQIEDKFRAAGLRSLTSSTSSAGYRYLFVKSADGTQFRTAWMELVLFLSCVYGGDTGQE